MFKCFVVAPYEGFKEMILELAKSFSFEMDVSLGNIRHGEYLLKKIKEGGYQVVICRGGTASFLRKYCQVPIIEVNVTSYDILRTFTLLKGYQGKIGMMGSPNLIQNVKIISELLEMNVVQYSTETEQEIEQAIPQALNHGIGVVIGDGLTVSYAEAAGLQTVMITSGKEALLEALEKVANMFYMYQHQRLENIYLHQLMDRIPIGLLVMDKSQRVILANQKLKDMLEFAQEESIHSSWQDWLKVSGLHDSMPLLQPQVIRWKEKIYLLEAGVCSSPFHTSEHTLFFLKDATEIRTDELLLRKTLFSSCDKETLSFTQLVKRLHIKEDPQHLERWNKTANPVLIIGEQGTYKKELALAMHQNSIFKNGPFLVLDTNSFTSKDSVELNSDLLEKVHQGTLFIKDIDQLPHQIQTQFNDLLGRDPLTGSADYRDLMPFRLIASSSMPLFSLMQSAAFDEELYYRLNSHTISIPPLRERLDDLEDIVRWFLAESNQRTGKQVVSIDPDVIKRLKTYSWPGNLFELTQVLNQLIERCSSMFITKEIAKPVIEHLFSQANKKTVQPFLSNHSTLEEIERNIIEVILEQEQYNQSKVAQRLGISRATLWRKLKK